MNIKRRVFNRYVGLGAGVGFIAGYQFRSMSVDGVFSDSVSDPRTTLKLAAKNAVGIHQIGLQNQALRDLSEEELEQQILENLKLQAVVSISTSTLEKRLQQQIETEFSEMRTVTLAGFILSETEGLFVAPMPPYAQALDGKPFVPATQTIREGTFTKVERWGPQRTVAGRIFNEQPDGHGGIWVMAKNTPLGAVIEVNRKPIKTRWKATLLTGAVYDARLQAMIVESSTHDVSLLDKSSGVRQLLGKLTVEPRPAPALLEDGRLSTKFCEISEIKQDTNADGHMLLKIYTRCAPRSTAFFDGDREYPLKVLDHRIDVQTGRRPSKRTMDLAQARLVDMLSGAAVSLKGF